jgi:hypothetical protein
LASWRRLRRASTSAAITASLRVQEEGVPKIWSESATSLLGQTSASSFAGESEEGGGRTQRGKSDLTCHGSAEGRAQGVRPVLLRERVKLLDLADPGAGPAVG